MMRNSNKQQLKDLQEVCSIAAAIMKDDVKINQDGTDRGEV